MMNHLWQSTVFAAACALLALAMKNNRAQVRYWIWLAASVKFLLPFSILVEAGKYFGRHTAATMPTVEPQFPPVVEQVSAPFVTAAQPVTAQLRFSDWVPAVVWTVWAVGFAVLALRWWIRWRTMRAALRIATPLDLPGGVKAMTSPAFAEPGVFGIWRPVLLLPQGIADCLTAAQLDAIVAHELCHIRRRDNLATALHMTVEALCWLHPLVWWIGARLMEERERACDEEVLRQGSEPEAYAEGILKICELYMESPLACVSGVSGGNLKKRIEEILRRRIAVRLSAAKKALLATAAAAAIAAPVWMGILHAPVIQAQDAPRPDVKFEVASIKACKSDDVPGGGRGGKKGGGGGGGIGWDPAMLHEKCQSLYNLIRDAYLAYPEGKPWSSFTREASSANARGLEKGGCTGCGVGFPPVSRRLFQQELEGAPGWVTSDRYTIDAKTEKPQTPEMMRGPMMQTLLEERFKLKIHQDTRDVPVYELTVAAGGPKLAASVDGTCLTFAEVMKLPPRRPAGYDGPAPCGSVMFRDGRASFPGTTVAGLCQNLSFLFDRDVVDKTGIKGFYNVVVDADRVVMPADDSAPRDPDMPPRPPETDRLATAKAFQKAFPKIGLKLEPAKGAGVFLVIDHVERPTEN